MRPHCALLLAGGVVQWPVMVQLIKYHLISLSRDHLQYSTVLRIYLIRLEY